MKRTSTAYNVKIDLHELRNIRFQDAGKEVIPNPYVTVTVCGVSQQTPTRQQTTTAQFNSQFNFDVRLSAEEFTVTSIEVQVWHAYLLSSGLIGVCSLGFTNVYGSSQHWIYRQWLRVRNFDRPSENIGTVLLSVGIFGPGDSIPVVEDQPLAAPEGAEGGERQTAAYDVKQESFNLSISVHKGSNICAPTNSPSVKVKHAGAFEQTKMMYGNSPEWNTGIVLPAATPSLDDNILLELYDGEGSSAFLMGVCRLNLQDLIKEPLLPTWLNYYWREPSEGVLGGISDWLAKDSKEAFREATAFAGRILVSAFAQKVQLASGKGCRSASPATEPFVTEYLFGADIYEITNTTGDRGPIKMQIAMGSYFVTTPQMEYIQGSYLCDETNGRLEAAKVYLPPLKQCAEVFIYVVVDGGLGGITRKIAMSRMPITQMIAWGQRPLWTPLYSCDTGFETFSVLITFFICPASNAPLRPERLAYNVNAYYFRAMIYEAVNLPCVEASTGEPDVYVRVELAGRQLRTKTVKRSRFPHWYEAFEVEVVLPENRNLAPDITVEVMAASTSFIAGDVSLGLVTFPIKKVPPVWDVYPEWLKLRSSSARITYNEGKVLCSFELVDTESADASPFFDDIRPSSVLGSVKLFLVGVRLFETALQPQVKIRYGRKHDESDLPLVSVDSGKPVAGLGGNWNYMRDIVLEIDMPKRHIHNAMLEFLVIHNVMGFAGEAESLVGAAYVSLTPLLPWLGPAEQTMAAGMFKTATLEEVQLDLAATGNESMEASTESAVEKHAKAEQRTAPRTMSSLTGAPTIPYTRHVIPHNEPTACNFTVHDEEDFVAINEEEEKEAEKRIAEKAKRLNTVTEDQLQLQLEPSKSTLKPETRLASGVGSGQMSSVRFSRPSLRPASSNLNFELVMPDDDLREEERRETIDHELEAEIGQDLLPYVSVPILRGTTVGVPETIGWMKFVLAVFQGDRSKKELRREQKMREGVEWLREQQEETRDLVVRLYCLAARGVCPPSGSSDPSVYLSVKCAEDSSQLPGGLSHNVVDNGNIRRQGFKPEFNKCFALHCSLPDHAVVQLALWEAQSLRTDLIGSTYMDIEDRWMNPRFRIMMQEESVPVEQRSLKRVGVITSQGSFRLWAEIMTLDDALSKPITALASPDPEEFQLRVVIWEAKGVPLDDNAGVNFYVRGTFQRDETSLQSQDTDTHYHSHDGTGVFRWRMVWPALVPAPFPSLKLQLMPWSLLGSGSPIGECVVDLSYDFAASRKMKGVEHSMPRTWFKMYLPGFPDKYRGQVEISATLLTSKEADFNPVGKGRDDPNRNPYLEPVEENRTYVDWKEIQQTISDAAQGFLKSAKWGVCVVIVIAVVCGILFLVILLR